MLYPAAAAMHVRGDRSGLERLYHDGSRLMLLVMILVVLAGGLLGTTSTACGLGRSI